MTIDFRSSLLATLMLVPVLGWSGAASQHNRAERFSIEKRSTPPGMGAIGSAAITTADAIGAIDVDPALVSNPMLTGGATQSGVFPGLGMLQPTYGTNMLWLSTGIAGSGTTSTVHPDGTGTQGTAGGNDVPPLDQSCGVDANNPSDPFDDVDLFDCASFAFTFTVPIGMNSVKFDFDFMSSEYPEYVGSLWDDRFTVSLQSPTHSFPNIVFDAVGNETTINSAFFNQPCSTLVGTGFDIVDFFGDCDAGGTGLLTTSAPVVPGEVVTITFSVADGGDSNWDSAVMIDNFILSEEEVEAPTTEGQVVIDYLSPKSGPLAGGTSVLVYGDGFVDVSAVSFDGVQALFTVLDENTIQTYAPPHSEGSVYIAVTASPGVGVSTGVKANAYIYYVSPSGSPLQVLSVDPPEGPGQGGVAVAVRGSGFKSDTIITFDGEAVESQEFINGDEIIIVTPNGSGNATVRAVNPDGTDAELEDGYLYIGNGASGGPGNGFTKGCSCSLSSTSNPASGAAAPLAIAGLVFAAWLVRRRSFNVRKAAWVASVPVAFLTMGCNDQSLAPVNSAPIADAGPSSEAFVGDEVTLDGTGSRDFEDDANIEFAWEIVSKPQGSNAVLDDISEKTPSFLADLPGLYRIGLIVTDSDLIESGPIGYGGTDDDNLTDVIVLPFRDLRVTLSWDTDADLDLHLIRPNGFFNGGYWDPEYDCFYGAPDAEWGQQGVQADNPLLAADVDTGMGPEEISVGSPQDNGVYRIMVHAFHMHDAPQTDATVTISVEGVVLAEVVAATQISLTDTVWKVGTIAWPDNAFTEENAFTTHGALGGPAH